MPPLSACRTSHFLTSHFPIFYPALEVGVAHPTETDTVYRFSIFISCAGFPGTADLISSTLTGGENIN